MASTLQRIEALAKETAGYLCRDAKEWIRFLSFSSRIYLYPFTDQLLIYGQRPDATACAPMEVWNKKMNCRIRKGSTGIALIEEKNGYRRLRYVFDVSDTIKMPQIGKEPLLWHLEERREEEITSHLRNTFMLGETLSGRGGIPGVIIDYVLQAVNGMLDELISDLKGEMEGSTISTLGDKEIKENLEQMVLLSSVYVMMERCGFHGEFHRPGFTAVRYFDTVGTLAVVGGASQQICSPFLKEIGRYLRRYPVTGPDLVAKNEEGEYNEFNTLKRESGKEDRSYEDESDIHSGRRSDDPGSDNGRGERGYRQIRLDENEIFAAAPQGDVRIDGPFGDAQLPPSKSQRPDEAAGREDEAVSSFKEPGTGQADRPDGVGEIPKPGESPGGGDGASGDDLPVSDLLEHPGNGENLFELEKVSFPSEARQEQDIFERLPRAEQNGLFPEELVNMVLRTGGGKENSILRILAAMIKGARGEELSRIIADEYSIGGKGFVFGEEKVSLWYDDQGMILSYGESVREGPAMSLTWEEVSGRILSLYEKGAYASSSLYTNALENERREVASSLFFLLRDGLGKLPEQWRDYNTAIVQIGGVLKDEEKCGKLFAAYSKTKERFLQSGRNGGYYLSHCDKCLQRLEYLARPGMGITQSALEEVPSISFITRDEIDLLLQGGTGYKDGRVLIYRYFITHPEKEKRIAFLKKAYGTGGSTTPLPASDAFDDYDGKGITLKKGILKEPEASVRLSWGRVSERIWKLIREERYLTGEELLRIREEEAQDKDTASMRKQTEIVEKEHALPPENEPAGLPGTDLPEESPTGNYQITSSSPTDGGPKQRFSRNILAITLLKELEAKGRGAGKAEQEILSGYAGFGGIPEAFDKTKENWKEEVSMLRSLLTDEEYSSARGSVLNAHYTQPVIIEAMYEALSSMGFLRGNILEPAMGTGNFFGMLPEKMRGSALYGVELDPLTGRIAKMLYPDAKITISGFEKTAFPDDFFDVAIGNVPFGNYGVNDRRYNRYGFLIHDYFLAKTIDLLRPGGVMAFITSKGTMDKENDSARKYLHKRADLLGAVRLPNNAFHGAGTKVTCDILFFQKRQVPVSEKGEWLKLAQITSETGEEMKVNAYFSAHPEMVLGKMELVSGPYGKETACLPLEEEDLKEQLRRAMRRIQGNISAPDPDLEDLESEPELIPAIPGVQNFSFALWGDQVYFRENSMMRPVPLSADARGRAAGMIALRDVTRSLINLQLEDEAEEVEIRQTQVQLNELYDDFTASYGLINSPANKRVFSDDSSYCLLCSLEVLKEDGSLDRKADMFTKRTIKRRVPVSSVSTAQEALVVSVSEKARVDLPFMSSLCGKEEEEMISELRGVIFLNPQNRRWETADEYLSGNVREKLKKAREAARYDPSYKINVESLTKVIPKDLDASQIDIRLGASWLSPSVYQSFMGELLHTPGYLLGSTIDISYSPINGLWHISGKNADSYHNVLVTSTYGTERINAYAILEQTLNLRNVQVFDLIEVDGKEKRILNRKETMLASQKQDAMKEAFRQWIFKDPIRREKICRTYNDRFNAIRPREYDGSAIPFPGMNPEITLREHQRNAVAHQIYGGNTLLAHVVGAGKTFEMAAAAMEGKRLGFCEKSLFVVPNHLTGQWGAEFLQLYPGANILVATRRDFEPSNRRKFCARIALGNYDAVIIGHSQFEKIPLSIERQKRFLTDQIEEITDAIYKARWNAGQRFSVKEMEKTRKSLQVRLEKLSQIRQDDVVTFEQLGVDHLFVDEAHYYKNAFLYTKMRNVAGISQNEAMKSSDMMAKCRYMDEITGGKGITFATGTPISNSMSELYIMQRYLQRDTLKKMGLDQFDAWASTFGEVVTAVELAPEGTGYRVKSRFSKFYNIPELMSVFKEAADIKTADQLSLPVPKAEYETIVLPPSHFQKEIVSSLADRAEKVRSGSVDPSVDNMLKITNDGRKAALEQRLINPLLPDDENSKVNACVRKCFSIWEKTKDKRLTQLIFCDLSTPKEGEGFSVYTQIKEKLEKMGIPGKEIAFIHDAKTDAKKEQLFAKVRSAQVRILLGSTSKMGAGTNVQDKLIALHHLDIGWRPSDLEQREGRIIRQGNENETVHIYRYVTENTFDSYMWQLIESKQKFIAQIMTSKAPVRSCEDVDETALSYAEVKAIATGNPLIKEKMQLDVDVAKLKVLKSSFESSIYRLEDEIASVYPARITAFQLKVKNLEADVSLLEREREKCGGAFSMCVAGEVYPEKKDAGGAILAACSLLGENGGREVKIGSYLGFSLHLSFSGFDKEYVLTLKGSSAVSARLGSDSFGVITRINNALDTLPASLDRARLQLEETCQQLAVAKEEVQKPFPREAEYREKSARLSKLNAALSLEQAQGPIACGAPAVAQEKVSYMPCKRARAL